MRLKAIAALILVSITMSLTSCTKVNYNKSLSNNTESGNVLVNSNLMNSINSLGLDYEFIPLEYKNGVVRGIVSPEKIDKYFIYQANNIFNINPLAFTEYTVDVINLNNSYLKETGEVLLKSGLTGFEINNKNPLDIIINDNIRKKQKRYEIRLPNNYRIEDSHTTSYVMGKNGNEFMVAPDNNVAIYDENNTQMELNFSGGTVVGKDKRYIYFNYEFREKKLEENKPEVKKLVYVLYDSESQETYELEINDLKDYIKQGVCFFDVKGTLYCLKATGEISKVILTNGDIELEDFYNFKLGEGQWINSFLGYNNNYIDDNDVIFGHGSLIYDSFATGVPKVFNFEENIEKEYPISVNFGRIFGEDNLVLIYESSGKYITTFIAKLEGSNYEKLVQIDEYSMSGTDISNATIEDILYDSETKSFFIKRKVKIDKKQTYQYEVVSLN